MTAPSRPDGADRRHHFILDGVSTTEGFVSRGRGNSAVVPARDRASHGRSLRAQLAAVKSEPAIDTEALDGIIVEFEGFHDVDLAFESLARDRSGIELRNVHEDAGVSVATVFVPLGKFTHFENLIEHYVEARTGTKGQALDHRRLVDTIHSIRTGTLRGLWTDDEAEFPRSDTKQIWWEVWLPVRRDREAVLARFRTIAEGVGLRLGRGVVEFPERTIVVAFGTPAHFKRSVALLNLIAELRLAKETADFFDSLDPAEQVAWVDELLGRVMPAAGTGAPYVCVLDTGVARGHPLLAGSIAAQDLHTVDPAWGTDDQHGHGTQLAGLALFGDLTPILAGSVGRFALEHRLESVKLLPRDGANEGDDRHHGFLTLEAAARAEVTAPERSRVLALAVTSRDRRDRGRPSAWSAAIDRIAADAANEGESPRLVVVSAGNSDPSERINYPASNTSDSIHDPAQAWNALTVGSFTNLVTITEPDAAAYRPVASVGALSPFSTTSATWDAQWPLKPDVVFEGGNAGRDAQHAFTMASLSLLTTHHRPEVRMFTTMCETSASTALGAQMAARLMAEYRNLRPESIRGLIVHSAEWTPEMRRMHLPQDRQPTKLDYANLVRHCGFGVPDLERARWSVANSLAMIVEERLQPFSKETGKQPKTRDMQMHELPWPLEELERLGEMQVEMRVTLSYFIEPNPSNRGGRSYGYQSHALRFEVKRPEETVSQLRSRINRAARAEEEGSHTGGYDPGWTLGTQLRHRGSIHSDIWRGTAAALASRGVIAVYPAMGWWRTRAALAQYDRPAPYSLIVSIRAPQATTDLYAAVANQIRVRVASNA